MNQDVMESEMNIHQTELNATPLYPVVQPNSTLKPKPKQNNLMTIGLVLLLLAGSYFWTDYSSRYIGKLRLSASVNCTSVGCGGAFGLGWLTNISFTERIIALTYGSPGILASGLEKINYWIFEISFHNPSIGRNKILALTVDVLLYIFNFGGYIAAGIFAVTIPFVMVRLVTWKKTFGPTNDLLILLCCMMLYIGIGLVGLGINKNTFPEKKDFLAEGRDNVRKSDTAALTRAIELVMQSAGSTALQLPSSFQEISSYGADMCSFIVPRYISCLPQDPTIKIQNIINPKNICNCNEPYETGYQIKFDPQTNTLSVRAPKSENTKNMTVEKRVSL